MFQVSVSCILFSYHIVLFLPGCLSAYTQGYIDTTKEIGLSNINGVIAAFGDFDSDRDTDLFVIADGGKKIEIYLWQGSNAKFAKTSAQILASGNRIITNVAPADFDGNGCMDVLVVTRDKVKVDIKVTIYWSNDRKFEKGFETEVGDEPLILDTNGDLLPDFYGQNKFGERTYWISQSGTSKGKRKFLEVKQSNVTGTILKTPNTNAFVDMTKDFHADLFVVAEGSRRSPSFEIWEGKKETLKFKENVSPPNVKDLKADMLGQMSFADFDADGSIDVLLPICMDSTCDSSVFYLYTKGEWKRMLSNEESWWIFPHPRSKGQGLFQFQIVARQGDINMDGYPDAVCIFQRRSGGRRIVILENVPCPSSSLSCDGARTFRLRTDLPVLQYLKNPVIVTLFDLYENGALDFLVVEELSVSGRFALRAVKNDFSSDTSFIKTAVLSGRCYKECTCRSSHTPYGANQPGAMVMYETTNPDGKKQKGIATQLCQSAYFSLQLPYIVFGLGRTPNFVDQIQVGIPQGSTPGNRVHQWQSLIPNSQVIILPFPADKPAEWLTKLLVTPSKLLLQVGGVLLGICLLVAGLILILHIKEKREDEREKRQEAHKFHFDAL